MRHRNRRGKLGKKSAHRNMMLRNMAASLFVSERIQTTLPKAKQLRPFAEKLITLARRQDLSARRQTLAYIQDKTVVKKLFGEIATRFKDGNGGYIRIIPYRSRWGDGAELAFIELKDAKLPEGPKEKTKKKVAKEADKTQAPEKKKSKKKAKKGETQEE